MAWRFLKRGGGGKASGASAGGRGAAALKASTANAPADAPVASEPTSEEQFAAWYEQQWPHQPVFSSAAPAAAAAARAPGSGLAPAVAASGECLKVWEQRRGEYWCAYGADALQVADAFFRTRDVLKFIPLPSRGAAEQRALPALSFSPRKLLTILQTLVLSRGESLEIWRKGASNKAASAEGGKNDEEDEAAADGSRSPTRDHAAPTWFCLRRVTPGNLDGLEELLGFTLSSGSASTSVAIRLSPGADGTGRAHTVAMAFVDPQARTARVLEFVADDASFASVEHAVVAEGATQAFLLIPSHVSAPAAEDWRQVRRILEECKIPIQRPARNARGTGGSKSAAAADSADAAAADELQAISSGASGPPLTQSDAQELSRFMSPSSPLSLQAPGVLERQKHSLLALQFLLRALSLSPADEESSRLRLDEFRLDEFCRLDNATWQALSLFPRAGDDAIERTMSLYGVLNKTRTSMGSRSLAALIRQPLTSRDRIVARQDFVELFVRQSDLRAAVRDQFLRGAPDLQRLSARFQKRKGTLADVMEFYRLGCIRLPQLRDALVEFAAMNVGYESSLAASASSSGTMPTSVLERLHADFISPLSTHLASLAPFNSMVEQAVLVEESSSHDHVRMAYRINPNIHPTLAELAAVRAEARAALDAEVSAVQEHVTAASNDSIQPKLAYSDVNKTGFHLRLTKTEQRKWGGGADFMPGGAAAVKVIENRRDGLHFTTRRLEKVAQTLQALTEEYDAASEQLLGDVLATTSTYSPVLDAFAALLSQLDVYATLAHVAVSAGDPWVRPTILPLGSNLIELRAGRHACMEMLAQSSSGSYIPADARLEKGASHLQIITGPNMGGKSSYCRMVGLNILLAQIGSFVPAASATVSVVDSILCRVGAGDSTARAQSTFLVEMLESAAILKQASSASFVLVDELGRGTSIDEGAGIAFAFAEHLAKEVRCFTLFATHYHELTALEEQQAGVVNQHVEVHESEHDLTMLYTLAPGPSDRSYGVHCAKLAHFPPHVVQAAARMAAHIETFATESGEAESKEQQMEAMESQAPTPEQLQLLSHFRRGFSSTDDAASLADKLHSFQTEHAALIAAVTGEKQAHQPNADVAAMDES